MSGCIGVNAGEVYAKFVVGGGEHSGDAGGVWNCSSSSPICSIKGRGGGASVMRSSRLRGGLIEGDEVVVARLRGGGLGGSGVYSPVKGDEIVVGGVVVMFIDRMRMVLSQLDTVAFKPVRRLIAVGCF